MAGLFAAVDVNAVNVDCGEWIAVRQVLVKMDTTVAASPGVFLKSELNIHCQQELLHKGEMGRPTLDEECY